jgi:hypothetical protein
MNEQSSVVTPILARVEKLERENARLKRTGAAALIVAGALLLMGQTKQGSVPWQKQVLRVGTLQANRIEVLPEEVTPTKGFIPVPSVRISGNQLAMFDSDGKARLSLDGGLGLLQMGELEPDTTGHFPLFGKGSNVSLWGFGKGAALRLKGADGKQTVYLSANATNAGISLESDAPTLSINGTGKQATVIGSQDIVSSGKTYKTSAASIFLFDDKGNSIWSAEQAGNLEMLVSYLQSDVENRRREVRDLSDQLDHFKKAVCPVLRTARMGVLTKSELDSACGLY